MYALIVPASTPLVLLAVVMALSWWEDRILPPAETAEIAEMAEMTEMTEAPAEAPIAPATTAQHLALARVDTALAGEVAGPLNGSPVWGDATTRPPTTTAAQLTGRADSGTTGSRVRDPAPMRPRPA
ncbi:hypothetical protein RB628_34545 [Streptomyces sp. ADMS]|uniref:hypothetical protein n=1 Tax=Streptomyces sp. ADMS TaxID=3071415 RepID=UPI00296F35D6|nr:hypothetical protein [Streptomyces sp. ADMS]MDW4910313.1 hypothetical protein [Streptomyces sp. ADMS]